MTTVGRKRATARTAAGVLVFLACAGYALAAGLRSDGPSRWIDAQWLYVSGKCWLAGGSPYDVDYFFATWQETLGKSPIDSFVYPPHIAVLTVPLALFEWETARRIIDGLNVAALAACLVLIWRLIPAGAASVGNRERRCLCLGAACLLSSVPAVLYIGQTSLIALVGLLGTLYFARKRQRIPAAICVFVACLKPHITLLALIYLIFQGAYRSILFGIGFVVLFSTVVLLQGPLHALPKYATASADSHMSISFNAPEAFTGLGSLLVNTPFGSLLLWITVGSVAASAVGLIHRSRSSKANEEQSANYQSDKSFQQAVMVDGFCVAMALTGVFMPLHTYDFVIYMPILAVAFAGRRRCVCWLLPGLLLVGRPSNIFAQLDLAASACREETVATLGAVWILAVLLARWYLAVSTSNRVAPLVSRAARPVGS